MAKIHWQLIASSFILWCLVDCAAAKCPPERCGSKNVSYPFWITNPNCGYPGFKISSTANMTLFLPTPVGDFEILEIDYSGYIIINSTSLKAMSCNGTDDAFKVFSLPLEGPFTISSLNRFVVIGCKSMGSFSNNTSTVDGRCESACVFQTDPIYCNTYGCCEAGITENQKFINFTGGGRRQGNLSSGGVCGFSTILQPDTFTIQKNEIGVLGGGLYGLRVNWGVGHEKCSAVRGTSNYSCAEEADCKDSPTGKGHVCTCRHGYQGNGYSNGTDCTDVDECCQENSCVSQKRGEMCTNFAGSYNCSCQDGYL